MDYLRLMARSVKYLVFQRPSGPEAVLKNFYYLLNGGFTSEQVAIFNLNTTNKTDYLSEFDWIKYRSNLSDISALNLDDKVRFSQTVSPYERVPEILFVHYKDSYGKEKNGSIVSQIKSIIKDNLTCIVKPIKKGQGKGVHKLDFREGVILLDDEEICEKNLISLLNKLSDWIITEYIEQDGYAHEVFPKTLNTIRLISIKKGNEYEVDFAVHRFGRKNTGCVDNASQGGLVSKINIETGELSDLRSIKKSCSYKCHPDTGVKVKSKVVPGWKGIKLRIEELSKLFPQNNLIAWDIAVVGDEIVIVEGNATTGINILQLWEGQKNTAIGKEIIMRGFVD
ncbi:sugar-transfer associated ATP-grasp domain-containing protein [Anaerovoracaceae bacterium SGI.195]